MATKYEEATWVWDGQIRSVYGNTFWYAQTFTPQTTHDITSVILLLGRPAGDSPGTVTVSIRVTTAGKPSGDDLCSGTTDGNTVPQIGWPPPPSPEEREITFDTNPTLTAGTKYAIVVRALDGSSGDKLYWAASISSVYADGDQCHSSGGSSWTLYNTRELWFEEYGNPSTPNKPTNPTPVDTGTDIDFSNLTLSWEDGGGADTYNVYVGDAANNLTLLSSVQAGVSFVLSDIQRALFTATGWWRIDATNVNGTTTGDDWSFTVAAPGKAQTPTPTDDQEDIKITGTDQLKILQWEAPA